MTENQRDEKTLKDRAKEIHKATGLGHQKVLELLRAGDTWRDRLATPNPSKRDVELAARIAVARAFNGRVDGRRVVDATVDERSGLALAIAARHERDRGYEAMLDGLRGGFDPSWDFIVLVRFAPNGSMVVAQMLDDTQVAAYRAARLPRHDRLAFNETSFHRPDGTQYGTDIRGDARRFLNWPAALPLP
ncbi:hypothetical protein [Embleya sp. NPDC020630]|uniref:hypothetical protein n=1 Tax=Embleya sp. NPDC020630 TaxID=3363979 RepID=UPI0037B40CED